MPKKHSHPAFRIPDKDKPYSPNDTIRDLSQVLERCLVEMDFIGSGEECDHQVGVCWCEFHRAREDGRASLRSAKLILELED